MRAILLVCAGLALVAFVAVGYIVPEMSASGAKSAAQALLTGAEPVKQMVAAAATKSGSLAGSGVGVKAVSRGSADQGDLKWVATENGMIRGWNEKNAIEVMLTPALANGQLTWACRGFPRSAMPAGCDGR